VADAQKTGTSGRAAMSLETQSQIIAIPVISHHLRAAPRAMQAARNGLRHPLPTQSPPGRLRFTGHCVQWIVDRSGPDNQWNHSHRTQRGRRWGGKRCVLARCARQLEFGLRLAFWW